MKYEIGMKLWWIPDNKQEEKQAVRVESLRRHGAAKLSNGWVVDADGIAEGTKRIPGAKVVLA
jgi:hypothetical protein